MAALASKHCSKCGKLKSFNEFHRDNRLRSGITAACKACRNEKSLACNRKYYANNRDRMVRKHKDYRLRCRKIIDDLKRNVPCKECGEVLSPWQLQFDHVRGEKKFTIGQAPGHYGAAKIFAEAKKCDVVCVNCHEERTWYRKQATKVARNYITGKAKWLVELKESLPCVDCARQFPYYQMQFDHVIGVKMFCVNSAIIYKQPIENIYLELTKCDPVCGNCHSSRTHYRKAS